MLRKETINKVQQKDKKNINQNTNIRKDKKDPEKKEKKINSKSKQVILMRILLSLRCLSHF
jgi:hypothetical protein